MTAKFWQNNKNHFLQYFESYGNLSPSEVYDLMIRAGAFKKIEKIVGENTKFNCAEYLSKLEGGPNNKDFWCNDCQQYVDEDLDGCVEIGGIQYCAECAKEIKQNSKDE